MTDDIGYKIISMLTPVDEPDSASAVTFTTYADTLDKAIRLGRVLLSEPRPHWSLKRTVWIWDGESMMEVNRKCSK